MTERPAAPYKGLMSEPWLVLVGVSAIALLYLVIPVVLVGHAELRRGKDTVCPETKQALHVEITAHSAAFSCFGEPLRVARCPLWPERAGCAQRCVA